MPKRPPLPENIRPAPRTAKRTDKVSAPKQKLIAQYVKYRTDNIERLRNIMSEVRSQTNPRAQVLVSAGFLEIMLAHLIEQKLETAAGKPLSHENAAELFEGLGPFHTFDLKIKFCFACNFIDHKYRKDFDRIRKVRNYFAHEISDVSFEDAAVKEEIEKLETWKSWRKTSKNATDTGYQFIATIYVLTSVLLLLRMKDIFASLPLPDEMTDEFNRSVEAFLLLP